MSNRLQSGVQRSGRESKKARRKAAELVFFDETGFSFLEPLGRTWAPRGQRPLLRRVTRERRVLSTAIGLTLSGKIYKRHFAGAINEDKVIASLEHLGRQLAGPWILIWDRAPTHKSKKVQRYLAAHLEITVEWLPPYAPDLNPEEYCHGNVKQQMRNATPLTRNEMRTLADRGFARLRHRPDLILSFFHHAGLPVKQLWLT